MTDRDRTVGVVVPAYNAEATLGETLASVLAQTHREIKVIVVDDGSTDGTAALVTRHVQCDSRVHLLQQRNAGVAAARNAGWQHLNAPFYSFIDADDVWAPSKIERQLAALESAGPRAGLAYTKTASIDHHGLVIELFHCEMHEGDVLQEIALSNLVACGSNVLVRREVLVDTGGFDPGLRAAGGQGCEDWLFCCRVAEHWHYAGVPAYLVGYRQLDSSMSSDRRQMLLSHALMCEQLIARRPALRPQLLRGLQLHYAWQLRSLPWRRQPRIAWERWRDLYARYPEVALRVIWRELAPDPLRALRDRWLRTRASAPESKTLIGRPYLAMDWD